MKSVKSTITKLSLVVVAMYGFSYALVPIYDTFCEITGLNGKTNEVAYTGSDIEKENRSIIVSIFVGNFVAICVVNKNILLYCRYKSN